MNIIIVATFMIFITIANSFAEPSNLDCNSMLENSPKKTITESYRDPVLPGAAVGAAVGATAGAILSEDKGKGAVIGGIVGTIVGTVAGLAKGRIENNKLIATPRNKIPGDPPIFEVTKIEINDPSFKPKQEFKRGEYILILLRIQAKDLDENQSVDINYLVDIYKDEKFVGTLKDFISLPQGEYSDYMVIPVCKSIPPGNYKAVFKVIHNSILKEKSVEWRVVQ
ncbi:MAG: hypothetical protein ABWJ98_01025 [Hydrogenothermaceae bacterium]